MLDRCGYRADSADSCRLRLPAILQNPQNASLRQVEAYNAQLREKAQARRVARQQPRDTGDHSGRGKRVVRRLDNGRQDTEIARSYAEYWQPSSSGTRTLLRRNDQTIILLYRFTRAHSERPFLPRPFPGRCLFRRRTCPSVIPCRLRLNMEHSVPA